MQTGFLPETLGSPGPIWNHLLFSRIWLENSISAANHPKFRWFLALNWCVFFGQVRIWRVTFWHQYSELVHSGTSHFVQNKLPGIVRLYPANCCYEQAHSAFNRSRPRTAKTSKDPRQGTLLFQTSTSNITNVLSTLVFTFDQIVSSFLHFPNPCLWHRHTTHHAVFDSELTLFTTQFRCTNFFENSRLHFQASFFLEWFTVSSSTVTHLVEIFLRFLNPNGYRPDFWPIRW